MDQDVDCRPLPLQAVDEGVHLLGTRHVEAEQHFHAIRDARRRHQLVDVGALAAARGDDVVARAGELHDELGADAAVRTSN